MVFVDRKWIEEMESHKQKLEAHIIPGSPAFSEDPRKTSNDGKIKSKPSRHHLDSMVTRNIPRCSCVRLSFGPCAVAGGKAAKRYESTSTSYAKRTSVASVVGCARTPKVTTPKLY